MANTPLERRVTALEQQVAELSSQKLNGYDAKPWLAVAGIFAGDEGMKEIFDEALKLRERIVNSPAAAPRKPPHAEPNSDRLGHRSFVGLCLPRKRRVSILVGAIRSSPDEFATTIVCLEEQLRGWLAAIKRKRDPSDQVPVYHRLGRLWQFFGAWKILHFDDRAAERCKTLRKQKVRIGSQDLKIAAIALTCDALLLSANVRDFSQIPGLRVESWL